MTLHVNQWKSLLQSLFLSSSDSQPGVLKALFEGLIYMHIPLVSISSLMCQVYITERQGVRCVLTAAESCETVLGIHSSD